MRYKKFGNTGLTVSELCLGAMNFGTRKVYHAVGELQLDAAQAIIKAAVDGGINLIDTANIYGHGTSEQIVGQAIKNLGIQRDQVVIATKVHGAMGDGKNQRGLSRYHIMDQIKASLERLQTDHIDLYLAHGWDASTPIEETLRALDDCVRYGMVRYIGVSNWAAWQIMKALGISERMQLARFESVQAHYTVAARDLEREISPMVASERLGLMVWGPLAGGFLTGKYSREDMNTGQGRRAKLDFPPVNRDRAYKLIDSMRPMAESRGASIAQIALAWLLHQPAVTSVILGATRPDQIEDNIGACDVRLTKDELGTLAQLSTLPSEYPGWMLERLHESRNVERH